MIQALIQTSLLLLMQFFEIIKNQQLSEVIKNLYSEQYESAIQKILDLGKIGFFQKIKQLKDLVRNYCYQTKI
ncbi:MAG: hypothetical protein JW390_10004 [Nitrosopumilus sp.]|nr:hypothetical protein [Candidatus Nitrosopumilus limneticus]